MVLDHEFPPDIRVENEVQALHDDGHKVHIACFTQKDDAKKEVVNNSIIFRKDISKFIHKTSVGALKFPFYFNFWRSFLNEIFNEYTYDAIHIHDLPMAKVGYEFAKQFNIKFIIDLHENWPALLGISTHTKSILGRFLSKNEQWKKYEVEYCTLADNVIVVVDEAKERLIKLRIDPNKIVVVSNTLNLNHFEIPTDSPDSEYITLLYAGGINKHRGLQYVVQGLKHLNNLDKKLRIWILGSGSYIKELQELARNEEVQDKVFFLGWKDYKEMQTYFGKSDYCLIPHVKNDHTDSTIPHKIFQYMYAGKPMLVSNCLPLKRIVEETQSGLVYNYNSPEDFASKLKELINNKSFLSSEFANRNKRSVIKDYNWDIDSKKLNQIYK